jgi:hypothetical protein
MAAQNVSKGHLAAAAAPDFGSEDPIASRFSAAFGDVGKYTVVTNLLTASATHKGAKVARSYPRPVWVAERWGQVMLKTIIAGAAIAVAALSSSALAADMPMKAP